MQYWSIAVSINGEEVICIEPKMLAGADDVCEFSDEIEDAALNLLSFIGRPINKPTE